MCSPAGNEIVNIPRSYLAERSNEDSGDACEPDYLYARPLTSSLDPTKSPCPEDGSPGVLRKSPPGKLGLSAPTGREYVIRTLAGLASDTDTFIPLTGSHTRYDEMDASDRGAAIHIKSALHTESR